jgi:hypothetical protein
MPGHHEVRTPVWAINIAASVSIAERAVGSDGASSAQEYVWRRARRDAGFAARLEDRHFARAVMIKTARSRAIDDWRQRCRQGVPGGAQDVAEIAPRPAIELDAILLMQSIISRFIANYVTASRAIQPREQHVEQKAVMWILLRLGLTPAEVAERLADAVGAARLGVAPITRKPNTYEVWCHRTRSIFTIAQQQTWDEFDLVG